MVAMFAWGLRVGAGFSPPSSLDPCPTVTVTPVSSGGASSGRPRESRSMTRRPAASSSCATSYVFGAVVPSGISRTTVAEIPLHVSGQRGRYDSRRQQRDAEHEHSHSPRHRDRGLIRREPQRPVQWALYEPVQQLVHITLDPCEEPVEKH